MHNGMKHRQPKKKQKDGSSKYFTIDTDASVDFF